MAKITQSFQYGSHTVTLETGEIARQASGACLASMGDTVVLVTVVAQREPMPGKGFLPDDGRLPGTHLRRGTHSRRLLQTRRPAVREGNPHLAPD